MKKKTLDQFIVEMAKKSMKLAEQSIKLAETQRKVIDALKARMEKEEAEEDLFQSDKAERYRSCECFHSCKWMQYRIGVRVKLCMFLKFEQYNSIGCPSVIIPEGQEEWVNRLNNFLQHHAQYDSGLAGYVRTDEYFLNMDRNEFDRSGERNN